MVLTIELCKRPGCVGDSDGGHGAQVWHQELGCSREEPEVLKARAGSSQTSQVHLTVIGYPFPIGLLCAWIDTQRHTTLDVVFTAKRQCTLFLPALGHTMHTSSDTMCKNIVYIEY